VLWRLFSIALVLGVSVLLLLGCGEPSAEPPLRTPQASPDPHAIAILPFRSAGEYRQIQRTALIRVDSAIARHRAGRIQEAADLFVEAAIDFQDAQFEFGQAARHNGKAWATGLHRSNGTLADLMFDMAFALSNGIAIVPLVDETMRVLDDIELLLRQMMEDPGTSNPEREVGS